VSTKKREKSAPSVDIDDMNPVASGEFSLQSSNISLNGKRERDSASASLTGINEETNENEKPSEEPSLEQFSMKNTNDSSLGKRNTFDLEKELLEEDFY